MCAGKITTNSEMKKLHSLGSCTDENTTRNTPKVKLTRVVLLGEPLINGLQRIDENEGSRSGHEQFHELDRTQRKKFSESRGVGR